MKPIMEKYHGNTVEYWKQNAEENYLTTPISVLKYITILEEQAEQLRKHDVVGRSEQFYCVSSNSLVYGKPCEKWCGDENCKALCKQ
jgi:hypothetical protein